MVLLVVAGTSLLVVAGTSLLVSGTTLLVVTHNLALAELYRDAIGVTRAYAAATQQGDVPADLRALELPGPAADVVAACREAGVLVIQAGPNTVRLAPPLVITREELGSGLAALEEAIAQST